jgi:cysteine synthase A
VVTFACDLGERSFSKLWSPEYLKAQKLDEGLPTMGQLVAQYHELSL